tara:strand:- start:3985 stop:4197 length:213 start_codon:yes stop_codon:yes gene_type:complete
MLAGQVVIHCTEIQRLELSVRALSALDPGFLTDALYPLICTGDSITGTSIRATFPANRIDILSAAKETPE